MVARALRRGHDPAIMKRKSIDFALAPRPDLDLLTAEFAQTGVISIPSILEESCAAALHNLLRERDDWSQFINSGDRLVELSRATRADMDAAKVSALNDAVYAQARYDFQYRYETIRVPDGHRERRKSKDPLAAFAEWWSNGEPRDLLRKITGFAGIEFADAQATAYSPGDFLTRHSDDVEGKGRLAAYVLNLTPRWRVEWGGLLIFHDEAKAQIKGLAPDFNRLNIFRVPQLHSVSEVSRAAAFRRYAITGWLRTKPN